MAGMIERTGLIVCEVIHIKYERGFVPANPAVLQASNKGSDSEAR